MARLYVLDIANHFGADLVPGVVKAAEEAGTDATAAMLDWLLKNSSYGPSNRKELKSRLTNIASVMNSLPAGDRNSVDAAMCGIRTVRDLPAVSR
ncbi:hypothetical protein RAD16_05370 [Bradyrhizobium sp. 18BD]